MKIRTILLLITALLAPFALSCGLNQSRSKPSTIVATYSGASTPETSPAGVPIEHGTSPDDCECSMTPNPSGPVCSLIGPLAVTIVRARDAGLSKDQATNLTATVDFIRQTGRDPTPYDKLLASGLIFDPQRFEASLKPGCSGFYNKVPQKDTFAKCLIKKIYESPQVTAVEWRKLVTDSCNEGTKPATVPPNYPPPDDPKKLECVAKCRPACLSVLRKDQGTISRGGTSCYPICDDQCHEEEAESGVILQMELCKSACVSECKDSRMRSALASCTASCESSCAASE